MRLTTILVPALVLSASLMPMPQLCAADGSVNISRWNKNTLLINAPANETMPAKLALKLQVLVTMNMEEVDLVDAIEHLQRLCAVNIVIDPKLRNETRNITLNVKNMKAATVVKWLKELGDCHVSFMHEAVYFSAEKAKSKNKISIVDVSDLVMPIQNFTGIKMQIPQGASGGSQGGGGSMFTVAPETDETDADDIITVIEEVLENQGLEVE